MIRNTAFAGALALSTAFAVSACATETSYPAPASDDAYNSYFEYPYACSYDLGYECPPYVYGPPAIFGFDHFDHLDHFDHFHGGHRFAGHAGFGFGGHGGGGHR